MRIEQMLRHSRCVIGCSHIRVVLHHITIGDGGEQRVR